MLKYCLRVALSLFLITFCVSCENCLNMELIDDRTEEFNSWQTDINITEKSAVSSIGINDQVTISHDYSEPSDAIWDDCDQVTQSFRNISSYRFFNFPSDVSIEFYKQGEENGFEFITNASNRNYIFNFFNYDNSDDSPFQKLQDIELNNVFYEDLIKIRLNNDSSEINIKTIYFAKNTGIVQLILNNNIVINLDDID